MSSTGSNGHSGCTIWPVNGISDAAQQVIEFSATHRNVYPAMWCQVAANNPNALYSDKVHPNRKTRTSMFARSRMH